MITSVMMGMCFQSALKTRIRFLEDVRGFIDYFAARTRFESLSASEIISDYSASERSFPLIKKWNTELEREQDLYVSWKTACEENCTREDIELLIPFGLSIGKSDVEGEISYAEKYKSEITYRLNELKNSYKNKIKSTMAVCTSAGAFIVLLIV